MKPAETEQPQPLTEVPVEEFVVKKAVLPQAQSSHC